MAKELLVVYGSQTGNAEAIAKEFARELKGKCGLTPRLFCASKFEKGLWRRLRNTTNADALSNLRYAMLGLGDTNYSNFCGCAKAMDRKLKGLGAKPFIPTKYVDDAVGMEDVVERWKEDLWPLLKILAMAGSLPNIIEPESPEPEPTPTANGNVRPSSSSANQNTAPTATVTQPPASTIEETPEQREKRLQESLLAFENAATRLVGLPDDLPSLPSVYWEVTFGESATAPSEITPPPMPERIETVEPHKEEYSAQNPFRSKIISAKVMTQPDSIKRTLQVELDLHGSGIDFEPGDAFGILCENHSEEVDLILSLLGLTDAADKPLLVTPLAGFGKESLPDHIPPNCTVRQAFTKHLDLRSLPRKSLLRVLGESAIDEMEKKKLLLLASRQGAEHYNNIVRDGRHWLVDLLQSYLSSRPPLAQLLSALPPLLPRFYSAASSPLSHPHSVQFAFNVVHHEDRQAPFNTGVCTGWLDRLGTGPYVWIFPKPTPHFRLPQDPLTPVIMVGPGTGVAPFIGFLYHRMHQRRAIDTTVYSEHSQVVDRANQQLALSTNQQLRQPACMQLGAVKRDLIKSAPGLIWLFFGCRHLDRDFLYEDTIADMTRQGTLTRFSLATSRDKRIPGVRYVQDNMRIHGMELVDLMLHHNACFYVCGDAKQMVKDVDRTWVDLLVEHAGYTPIEAERMVNVWSSQKRMLRDVWA